MEIMWTAFSNIKKGNKRLMGQTSIIMFPIYGMASLLAPVGRIIKNRNVIVRGSFYTCMIFATEYITGRFLKKKGICPWDYSNSKYNIDGVIRLDYAPAWFGAGLFFERLVRKRNV